MRRRRRPSAGLAIAAVAALAVAAGLVALLVSSGGSPSGSEVTAGLAVESLVADDDGMGAKPGAHLEIALSNAGDRRAVVDRAEIEVLHVYELQPCALKGDLASVSTNGVSLATDAQPGEMVTAPLHRQLGAGAADRFSIPLGTRPAARKQGSVFLFELRVGLHSTGSRSEVAAGRALISPPQAPTVDEHYWGPETASLVRALSVGSPEALLALQRSLMPCWRAKTVTLRRALARHAVRSAQLAALAKQLTRPVLAARE